jgi:hypothetical protein
LVHFSPYQKNWPVNFRITAGVRRQGRKKPGFTYPVRTSEVGSVVGTTQPGVKGLSLVPFKEYGTVLVQKVNLTSVVRLCSFLT